MQIENVLTAHPEIREAAAIAVPDAKYGEVVGAWIVREDRAGISKEQVRQVVAEGGAQWSKEEVVQASAMVAL